MVGKEVYLWRNTVKTASQDKKEFEFCQQNNILGVGWCLRDADSTPYAPASIEECEEKGIKGKRITPFLLSRVKDLTEGSSLEANIKLVLNNADIGAKIAADI